MPDSTLSRIILRNVVTFRGINCATVEERTQEVVVRYKGAALGTATATVTGVKVQASNSRHVFL
jgi:hypothetical protein